MRGVLVRTVMGAGVAVVLLVAGACEADDPTAQPERTDPVTADAAAAEEEVTAVPDEVSEVDTADILEDGLVTYTSGDVEDRVSHEAWRFTDIGLEFGFDHAFRTGGSGTAELQFGDSVIIHLDESTDLRVEQLAGSDESGETVLELEGGSLRGRLDSLGRDEGLRVRTESTVVGVRGTAFEISHDRETGSSSVGVSTGEVVVSPRAIDEARLLVTTIADPQTGSIMEGVLADIETTVSAGEEVQFSLEAIEEIGRELERLLEVVPSVDDESLDEQEREQARETVRSRSDDVRERVEELSPETRTLDDTRRERLIDIENAVNVLAFEAPDGEVADIDVVTEDESDEARDEPQASPAVDASAIAALTRLTVTPEPADAAVALSGRPRSRGTSRALYPAGTEVTIRVTRDGYEPSEENIRIADDGVQEIAVTLNPETEEEPEAVATERQVEPEPEDPEPDEDTERNISLEFALQPTEATVTVDGEAVTGTTHFASVAGEQTVVVEAVAEGYAGEQREVTLGDTEQEQIAIALEPEPLLNEVSLLDAAVVRSVATTDDAAFAADFGGTTAAVDLEGRQLWRSDTANDFNENSAPILPIAGSHVHFSGTSRWYVFDRQTGNVVHERELDADSVHPFGRRLVEWDGKLVYPENDVLRVFEVEPAGTVREAATIPLESESSMTPLVSGNRAWMVSQGGTLYEVDLAGESVREVASTSANQPIGHVPAWLPGAEGQVLVFADRQGSVFAVDITEGELLWERAPGDGSAVLADPVTAGDSLLVTIGNSIHALADDGSDQFDSITDAAAAPLIHGELIVYPTTDGEVVGLELSAAGGAGAPSQVFRFPTGQALSTSVGLAGDDRYVVGTDAGSVLFIHASSVREW